MPAGGFTKECNTTGTAADSGYPEATFAWQVSQILSRRLRGLGARVKLTRTTNSERRWGPCVDKRGRAGNRLDADLKVSIHADGSLGAGDRGFHVIAPTDRRPWTHDVYRPSLRLAKALRGALDRRMAPAPRGASCIRRAERRRRSAVLPCLTAARPCAYYMAAWL